MTDGGRGSHPSRPCSPRRTEHPNERDPVTFSERIAKQGAVAKRYARRYDVTPSDALLAIMDRFRSKYPN